ncbi:MAG: ATP-binding protein [Actinobacteria bacterium]|nr:ATP-binding protein [Actinomycetota bacterium]
MREFVREHLGHSPRVEDALLVASELATNAILHAGTHFTVAIAVGEVIRMEISDASVSQPAVLSSPNGSGYGLRLVREIADRWGISGRDGGKTVWVELAVRESKTADRGGLAAG